MNLQPKTTSKVRHQPLSDAALRVLDDVHAPVAALGSNTFEALRNILPALILSQTYSEFLSQTRLRIPNFSQAADATEIKRLSHTLRGTAAMLGALQLAELAGSMEENPSDGTTLRRNVRDMEQACDALEAELQALGVFS